MSVAPGSTAPHVDDVLAVARRVCSSGRVRVERVSEGVSTWVYRVSGDGPVLYLRVLPEESASFAPEALVHRVLLERGARVPRVIYVDDRDTRLQRSVMVTTEVPGAPVLADAPASKLPDILAAAGGDLAIVNGVAVEGYGWVRRDGGSGERLRAESATYASWAVADVERSLAALAAAGVLSRAEVMATGRVVASCAAWATAGTVADGIAHLAHGDFDAGHIYQERGAYSGIIDFGEIRGTEPTYDPGQFGIEHPDWLPFLLDGYRDVAGPLPDLDRHIAFSSLVIATRRLAHFLRQGRAPHRPDLQAVARALRQLG